MAPGEGHCIHSCLTPSFMPPLSDYGGGRQCIVSDFQFEALEIINGAGQSKKKGKDYATSLNAPCFAGEEFAGAL